MQVNISGQHVEVTQPLRDYVLEKLARVESHFDKITNVQVIMKVEKLQQKVEATLQIPGGEVVANAEHEDMYAAIDALADKLDRQLKKHKEKQQSLLQGAAARCSPSSMIRLETILTPGRSLVNVPGGSKKRALEQIANLIGKEVPELDTQTVFESLIAREKLGSTGFGNGIAIPHCRLKGCEKPVSALLHLDAPIDFDAIDGAPVDLLFLLLVPEAATDAHLELLRQIASMLDRKDVRDKLRAATDSQSLYQVVLDVQNGH